MAPVIVFPDIVAALLPHLRARIASTTFAPAVPNPRPAGPLVTLRRVGGLDRVNGIFDLPRIDAQVWDSSDFLALALAGLVRAHLLATPGLLAGVSSASTFLGPTAIPDPESGLPRVLLTVALQVRGTPS